MKRVFNSLPHSEIVDLYKFKEFTDNNLEVAQMAISVFGWVKITVEKEENAGLLISKNNDKKQKSFDPLIGCATLHDDMYQHNCYTAPSLLCHNQGLYIFTNHSQALALRLSLRFNKFEINTTFDGYSLP